MEKRNLPVAVFDSGVGGVSVLREMVRLMPREDFFISEIPSMRPTGQRAWRRSAG